MRKLAHRTLMLMVVFLLAGCTMGSQLPQTLSQNDDAKIAEQTLAAFLDHLHQREYDEAARLYGGSYETMIEQNPSMEVSDHPALLKNACSINGAECLEVKNIRFERAASATEFDFEVRFMKADGSLFVQGPCCGGNETDSPSRSTFSFRVVKDGDSKFQVLDMPPYSP